jgi:hypothetical protein
VRGGPESGVRCRPPFSHAVRGSARSEGPGSRTARRGLGAWTNSDEALGVRSHSRVVRARHVSTSQLTLGRSPDNREYSAVRRFSSLRPRRSGFTKDLPPKPAFFVVLWRGGVRVRGTCFLGSKVATPATKTVAAPYSKFPCRPSTRRTVFSNHRQCVLAINSSCAPVGKKMAAGWMRGNHGSAEHSPSRSRTNLQVGRTGGRLVNWRGGAIMPPGHGVPTPPPSRGERGGLPGLRLTCLPTLLRIEPTPWAPNCFASRSRETS